MPAFKHLLRTMDRTFAVRGATTLVWISLSFTISWIENLFLVYLGNLSIWLFLLLLSQELSCFHFKKTLYCFSLVYSNCQHHYSCTLGTLLSERKVAWTQALWYWDSTSDKKMTSAWVIGKECTQHGSPGPRDDSQPGGGWNKKAHVFITLLRMVQNLKFMNYLFLEFSI